MVRGTMKASKLNQATEPVDKAMLPGISAENKQRCGVRGLRCYGMDENARYSSSARDTPRLQSGMSSCILNVNRLKWH